jgi:tetratricopeptide (TPR) repeat protein
MRRALVILTLLMATPAAAMTPMKPQPAVWICESADAFQKLSQVPALRTAHRVKDALALIARLSPADRASRQARFYAALLVLDVSGKEPAAWSAALAGLSQMVDEMPDFAQLSPPQRACPETAALYGIFSTLGVQYSQSGNLKKAEQYFLRGEANEAALSPADRSKLEFNLGVFYTAQLDLEKASYHLKKAQALTNPAASEQLQAIMKAQTAVPPK